MHCGVVSLARTGVFPARCRRGGVGSGVAHGVPVASPAADTGTVHDARGPLTTASLSELKLSESASARRPGPRRGPLVHTLSPLTPVGAQHRDGPAAPATPIQPAPASVEGSAVTPPCRARMPLL